MKFEYDEKKSQINKAKHNIDFVEAQKITAKEFDEKFDNKEDISEYLDFSKATKPNNLA